MTRSMCCARVCVRSVLFIYYTVAFKLNEQASDCSAAAAAHIYKLVFASLFGLIYPNKCACLCECECRNVCVLIA